MTDVTRILVAIQNGNDRAAEELLPLVYEELRRLAAQRLAHEKPGQTLQATSLVHEAYIRLVSSPDSQHWDGRGHFFVAAAEAMRRILVENARRKGRIKRGGQSQRQELGDNLPSPEASSLDELLEVHEALDKLEAASLEAARLVKLRYFAGLTIPQAAEGLGISARKANQIWAYARAWLLAEIGDNHYG